MGEEWVAVEDPFARRLIDAYLSRRKADIELLRSASRAGEFESVRVKGHNLIGSGSAYGLEKISEFGSLIEEAAKLEDDSEVNAQIDNLENYLRKIRIL